MGNFAGLVKDQYPVHKRLFPPGSNFRIYPKPGHQFWKGELEWPVVQLGPGVLAVNETDKNYIWEDNFRPHVIGAMEALQKSYAGELKFNRARLMYLDAVDYNPALASPSEFISRNLLTSIRTEYQIPGTQKSINIGQSFTVGEATQFTINIQNGINNATGNPSIIWSTTVERAGVIKKEELLPWLDNAHQMASDFFVKMLNPEFYASFD